MEVKLYPAGTVLSCEVPRNNDNKLLTFQWPNLSGFFWRHVPHSATKH